MNYLNGCVCVGCVHFHLPYEIRRWRLFDSFTHYFLHNDLCVFNGLQRTRNNSCYRTPYPPLKLNTRIFRRFGRTTFPITWDQANWFFFWGAAWDCVCHSSSEYHSNITTCPIVITHESCAVVRFGRKCINGSFKRPVWICSSPWITQSTHIHNRIIRSQRIDGKFRAHQNTVCNGIKPSIFGVWRYQLRII